MPTLARRLFAASFTLIAAATLAAQAPAPAAAGVSAEQARAFLGDWTMTADGPNGSVSFGLSIKDTGGKISGEIGSPMSGKQEVTDLSRAAESLVLKYAIEVNGDRVPVVLTLTPAGEKLDAVFDFASGQFTMKGVATRKA